MIFLYLPIQISNHAMYLNYKIFLDFEYVDDCILKKKTKTNPTFGAIATVCI